MDRLIVRLERLVSAGARDHVTIDRLGRALSRRGFRLELEAMRAGVPAGQPNGDFQRAAEVYLLGANSLRTRTARATCYLLASREFAHFGAWSREFDTLQKAVALAPWCRPIWEDLRFASVKMGRAADRLKADRMLRECPAVGLRPEFPPVHAAPDNTSGTGGMGGRINLRLPRS
jgi:hypothetical protein